MNAMWRLVLVSVAAGVAFVEPGVAAADPPATQVITVMAVGPGGEAINGYRVASGPGNVGQASDCSEPSPSAVADDVYYCSPSAAGAGTCWPSTPGSLLCVDNPWDMQIHRVMFDGQLPPVHPNATPDPFALALDDGTRCLLRNGGAWGGRADGYTGCTDAAAPAATLPCCGCPARAPDRASTARRRRGPSRSVASALRTPSCHRPRPAP